MQCPRCGLINPETAIACDCQYDFQTGALAVATSRALALPRATLGERFAAHFIDSAVSCGGMILGTHIGTSLGVGAAPAISRSASTVLWGGRSSERTQSRSCASVACSRDS